MITETKEALLAIRAGAESSDPDVAAKHATLFSFIRTTGMRPLDLADGTKALGAAMGDGTFFILQTKEGSYVPEDKDRIMPEWVAKRLDGATGQGIALGRAAPMLEAYRAMIGLPSPILGAGRVLDVECDSIEDVMQAMEAVTSPAQMRM